MHVNQCSLLSARLTIAREVGEIQVVFAIFWIATDSARNFESRRVHSAIHDKNSIAESESDSMGQATARQLR